MAASGGFSFGGQSAVNTTGTGLLGGPTGGGFSFGSQGAGKNSTPGTVGGGFSLGTSATPTQPVSNTGSFLLGAPNTTTTTGLSSGGFKLGGQGSTSLNIGGAKTVGQVAPTLKLGGTATSTAITTSASLGGFSFSAKTTASGLTLGGTTNTLGGTTGRGLTLGGVAGTGGLGTSGLGTGSLGTGGLGTGGLGTGGLGTGGLGTGSLGTGGLGTGGLGTGGLGTGGLGTGGLGTGGLGTSGLGTGGLGTGGLGTGGLGTSGLGTGGLGTGGLGTGGLGTGGLGAKKPLSLGAGLGLGGTATLPAVSTASKGLGGVDPASLKTTTVNTTNGASSTSKAVKETALPNEISVTVNYFKEYVKKQKVIREEIGRFSPKPMHKVKEDMLALRQLLSVVANSLQRNTMAIYKLKTDSAYELKNADMAHRTHDIPRALQMDHTAPAEYFQRLIQNFEEQMQLCHQEIEQIESHLMSLTRPTSYTPQDISLIMIKMNETFIALAAKLQTVHEAVKAQKEQYLNYRRVYHDDTQDIFAARRRQADKRAKVPVVPTGPGPFDNNSYATAIAMAAAMQSAQKPTGLPTGGLGFGFGAGGAAATGGAGFAGGGLFGSTNPGLGTGGLATGGSMIRPLGNQTTGGFGTGFGNAAKTGFGCTGSTFGTGTGFGASTGFSKTTFGSSGSSFGTSGLTLGTGLPSSNKPTNLSLGGSLSAGPTSTGFSGFGSSMGKKRGF